MKPILVCSGEPAGVGPDLCLSLLGSEVPLVVLCDDSVLLSRARQLGLNLQIEVYQPKRAPSRDHLTVLSIPTAVPVTPGELNSANAPYVMSLLDIALQKCQAGEFSALVTAPVHKALLNEGGYQFTGHTEFFAASCGVKFVVMMLASHLMKVALVTTHLPLADVPKVITIPLILDVTTLLHRSLRQDFGIEHPKIAMAGLNPHAGEGGYLGQEEIHIIRPAVQKLQALGVDVEGPMSADTMFVPKSTQHFDAYVVMYHDQGLPVLKYSGFGKAVNVTLGLPIVRTSVDHGTALELAGTGLASPQSLQAAIEMAGNIVKMRASQRCLS